MALRLLSPSEHPTHAVRAAPMTAEVSMGTRRTVVVLRGEADVVNRPVLCDMLCQQVARQSGDVVIDFGDVTFVDAAAVCVLAMGREILDGQGRKLTFRSLSRLAADVVHRFGLTDLIETDAPTRRARPRRLALVATS